MTSRMMAWGGRLLETFPLLFLPLGGPLLHPDDHYLLRYYAAINRIVQPVMHRVFALLQPRDGRTVKELLFSLDGYSNAKYKKHFTEMERSKLDCNEPSESFDITFLYKLLQLVCCLADSNDCPGSLENTLKRMKDHRNVLAHEELLFTYDELREKIKDLEELCRNVLVATGLRRRTPVIAYIAEMEKQMDEVLVGGIDLWEPYKDSLRKLRLEQTSVLLREGRRDVKFLSKNLRILNPFAWLLDSNYSYLDVEHIFTEVEIEKEKKVEMNDLLTVKLASGEPPDAIVISGVPGIGKTSLVRFLVHDWLSSNPMVLGMENVDLLLPIELRHVFSSGVRDLLKDEILRGVSQHLSTDDIVPLLSNVSLLWLFDGYDEASMETRKTIREILKKFPNSRILITTRTEFTQEIVFFLSQLNRSFISVELKGFSHNNIETCAKKLIAVSVHDIYERKLLLERFLRFTQEKNLLHSEIFRVPLYITIIVLLWLNDPDKLSIVKTSSALYTLLVDHIISKLMVRESYMQLNERKFLLEKKINRFLNELGKMLWRGKDLCFSLKQYEMEFLEEVCRDLGLPFTDTMSAFFICAERATQFGVQEEYTIIHRTLMEFLIARAFCNKMISEKWDVMTTAENWFYAARETLLQHEPENPDLKENYDLDNLSKCMPYDVYQSFRKKIPVMSIDNFYDVQYHCHVCNDFGHVGADWKKKNAKNFWHHLRDCLSGMWLVFLPGYLSLKQELNETRCEQLAFVYFSFTGMGYGPFSAWNIYVKEADNVIFNEKLLKCVANFTWAFYGDSEISDAKELMQYITPKSVFLHYCQKNNLDRRKNEEFEILITSVNIFMSYPIELHLDFRFLLSQGQEGIRCVKICLELLLNESSSCSLVTIRCPADVEIVRLLKNAIHLQELTLRFYGSDLAELAELIMGLPHIKEIHVALDSRSYFACQIPDGRNISFDSIALSDVFCVLPQAVGATVKIACSSRTLVLLHGYTTSLNLESALSYIFWVLTSAKYVRRLDMLITFVGGFNLHNEICKIQKLRYFVKRVFHRCTIRIRYSLGNIPPSQFNMRNKVLELS